MKSTNAKKKLQNRLARKEKVNTKDLRTELQILIEKKKENFMELFSKLAKTRKKSRIRHLVAYHSMRERHEMRWYS